MTMLLFCWPFLSSFVSSSRQVLFSSFSLSPHLTMMMLLIMIMTGLLHSHADVIASSSSSSPPPNVSNMTERTSSSSTVRVAKAFNDDEGDSCYLYLAPSSIPGAGLGIYSTRPFRRGSTILSSDYGPLIPIIDGNAVHDHWLGLFNNYIWGHFEMAPDQLWFEADGVTDYQPGLGIFPNYHPFLVNLGAKLSERVTYHEEEEGKEGVGVGVGVGAFSDYVGRSFFAMTDIEAGEELFLDYGEQYLNDRSPSMDDIPRSFDYEMAGEIVQQIVANDEFFLYNNVLLNRRSNHIIIKKEREDEQNMEDEVEDGETSCPQQQQVCTKNILSNTTKHNNTRSTSTEEKIDQLLMLLRQSLHASFPRVASLIPSNYQTLRDVVSSARRAATQLGNSGSPEEEEQQEQQQQQQEDSSSSIYHYGVALAKSNLLQRNVTWIQEYGVCMDNIMAGDSDVKGAGRGAKARRSIHKGDLIAPMPLLHVRHEEEFFTYQTYHALDGEFVMNKNDQVGKQLIYNYCFGDAELSLLLCPTTNGILANHCSDECNEPNAEIRWSHDPKTQRWLQKSPEEISRETTWVLSFDLVATRDIAKGEEIFIDYGKEWINAWKAHEEKMNQVMIEHESSTKRQGPSASDMFTACYYWEDGDDDLFENDWQSLKNSWKTLDDATAIQKLGRDGSKFNKFNAGDEEEDDRGSFWPCSILETKNSTTAHSHSEPHYTVRIFQSPWHDLAPWAKIDVPRILTNFPPSSVKMFHKPYKSPMHSRDAFRHHVGIPSRMIPNHWRDKKKVQSRKKFRHGDRVEVKDTKNDHWRTGTIVVNSDTLAIMMDDGNVIMSSDIQQDNIRWATSHLMQVISKTHPFH